MRQATKVVLSLVTLAGALLAGAAFVFLVIMPWHFNPSPPPKSYPKPASALEAQRQDLDYFRKLVELDRSFSPSARAEAERRIAALERSPQVIPRPRFCVELMRIGALADNGHLSVRFDGDSQPAKLPVRVEAFAHALYVMRATEPYAALLGGRVLEIDGHPIDRVMAQLEQLRGGTLGWREFFAQTYITWQEVLVGLGVSPDMEHSTWTVAAPDGTIVTRTLTPYRPSRGDPFVPPTRWYSSEPFASLPGWKALQPDGPLPVTLRNFDRYFRRLRLPSSCAMLVQLKSNEDEGGESIGGFLAATEADIRARPPCNVVLDLRFDTGGDYTNTARFAKALPGMLRPTGRIYVLVSSATFSAGITTAAFVKQAGGDRVTIVGEPVGDRLTFYSEGNRGCLPNLPLCMYYSTGKHDETRSCDDLRVCYWLDYLYPVRVSSLAPDETVRTTFADWKSGRDPVLERAIELAQDRKGG